MLDVNNNDGVSRLQIEIVDPKLKSMLRDLESSNAKASFVYLLREDELRPVKGEMGVKKELRRLEGKCERTRSLKYFNAGQYFRNWLMC